MKIKNLLFDLGGVILDIDRNRCVRALTELGMEGADEMLGLYKQEGPFLDLEEGMITAEEFREEIRRRTSATVSDEEIDAAFCRFLIEIPLYRLQALERLHQDYRIFMLSNTNAIMFAKSIPDFFKIDGKELDFYFDGKVLSFEEKCCKPNAKIFERVLEKFNIKAEETVFFDDSKANVEAAEALGFKGFHVTAENDFTTFFDNEK